MTQPKALSQWTSHPPSAPAGASHPWVLSSWAEKDPAPSAGSWVPSKPPGAGAGGETVGGVEVWAPLRTVHSSEPWGTQTQPCFQFRHVASLDTGEKIPNGLTFQEPNTAELWAESQANSP